MAMAAPDQRQAAAEAFSRREWLCVVVTKGKMILCVVVLALSKLYKQYLKGMALRVSLEV
ncbi:unnamed protein product [Prunus armeniaca]